VSLRIRIAKDSDQAFIIDAWKRSFEGAPAVRGADREHYRQEMTRAIRRLLDRATVRVACDPKDEDTIVGFCAFTSPDPDHAELHYVYVKRDFRGIGVMRELTSGVPITAYTFKTPDFHAPASWRFTPRFTIP
jgi:RimJ/RimL family protein N-acetyltransferase